MVDFWKLILHEFPTTSFLALFKLSTWSKTLKLISSQPSTLSGLRQMRCFSDRSLMLVLTISKIHRKIKPLTSFILIRTIHLIFGLRTQRLWRHSRSRKRFFLPLRQCSCFHPSCLSTRNYTNRGMHSVLNSSMSASSGSLAERITVYPMITSLKQLR
jgi:hypothetical protein